MRRTWRLQSVRLEILRTQLAGVTSRCVTLTVPKSQPFAHRCCHRRRCKMLSSARLASLYPTLRAAQSLSPVRSAVVARRLISTSGVSRAQQSSPHHDHSHEHRSDPLINPYKGGPSALDKAVHFFFLTEIFRGVSTKPWNLMMYLNLFCRSVDCRREFLQTTIYHHVSFRKGSPISSIQRRARTSSVPLWGREMHR